MWNNSGTIRLNKHVETLKGKLGQSVEPETKNYLLYIYTKLKKILHIEAINNIT